MTNEDAYIEDEASGASWRFLLGDSAQRMPEIEAESVHLSVYSPPFQSLYTYSASPRDMGNSLGWDDFFEQYAYIIRENLRITVPGGHACVHVQDVAYMKGRDGRTGLKDFSGAVIAEYEKAGWEFEARVTVDKDPQAQAIRTKAHHLMFVTKNKDSSKSSPAMPDYMLIFKKAGDRAVPVKTDVSNEEWIEWARPIWYGIRESNTLNARIARQADDERHLTPLQLDFIERCVRLWTNPGELVFTAFGGVGSELYVAVENGRRALGIELKASYWKTGCEYLAQLEVQASQPRFDIA
ncbi:DNA methylase [Cryobacterium zongtaii]|uniref:Methyltransferase n=1 Tax=Cryobacterium zongtaii TaxID=1259217 RepID=A0A2S3ZLF0_9MICO|nr:DNA methyltransferase [Cryobacterium zongtaii]POH69376.1 DNA methylase [Cryobacterium zongtaii]